MFMFKASRQQRREKPIKRYRGPKIRTYRDNRLQKRIMEIELSDGSIFKEVHPLESEMRLEAKKLRKYLCTCVHDVNFEDPFDR